MTSPTSTITSEDWCDAGAVQPCADLIGVEPEKVAPLHVRDAPFGDQTSNVADGDAEVIGHIGDPQQTRQLGGTRRPPPKSVLARVRRRPPPRGSLSQVDDHRLLGPADHGPLKAQGFGARDIRAVPSRRPRAELAGDVRRCERGCPVGVGAR